MIGIVIGGLAVLALAAVLDDLNTRRKNQQLRECLALLNAEAETADRFSVRRALRRSQEKIEELNDEIDQLRAECVVPESVGAGGQC